MIGRATSTPTSKMCSSIAAHTGATCKVSCRHAASTSSPSPCNTTRRPLTRGTTWRADAALGLHRGAARQDHKPSPGCSAGDGQRNRRMGRRRAEHHRRQRGLDEGHRSRSWHKRDLTYASSSPALSATATDTLAETNRGTHRSNRIMDLAGLDLDLLVEAQTATGTATVRAGAAWVHCPIRTRRRRRSPYRSPCGFRSTHSPPSRPASTRNSDGSLAFGRRNERANPD